MSCEDCALAEQPGAGTYYYRIGNANVAVRGCEKHVREMFRRLNSADNGKEEHPLLCECKDCSGKKGITGDGE